jgi:hypothetical protein
VAALTPFGISLGLHPADHRVASLALSLHDEGPRAAPRSAAVFYKEFFDAKKREYAARAEAIVPGSGA